MNNTWKFYKNNTSRPSKWLNLQIYKRKGIVLCLHSLVYSSLGQGLNLKSLYAEQISVYLEITVPL